MSESLSITGKVSHVGETEVFSSGFQKRLLVLEVQDGDYKNLHGFQVTKEKCDTLDQINIGDEVTAHFNLGTIREYESKWYSDPHRLWKIVANTAAAPAEEVPAGGEPPNDEEDLPF